MVIVVVGGQDEFGAESLDFGVVEDIVGFKWNSTINRLIKDMLSQSHIGGSQQITVHTARRSCVTALADFGVNIYTIQRIAGHARISTTQKYIQLSTATIEADLGASAETADTSIF